ncbi:glycoside hydrolase, partial [Clavulina sp. PMI_390]
MLSKTRGLHATLLLSFSILVKSVRGHGFVGSIRANSVNYTGQYPIDEDQDPVSSPIRQAYTEGPVLNVSLTAIACGGKNNTPAAEIAAVSAGSTLWVQWIDGSGEPTWPHDTGPLLTYMAPCSSSSCQDDPTTLDFFKIKEDGQVPGDPTQWVQAELMNGTQYQIEIPPGIPNGPYILRHEIISLQNAMSGGTGAESYPSCIQLNVSGSSSPLSQTAFMQSLSLNSTIKLPGGYNQSDSSWVVDVYTNPQSLKYTPPGPGIVN